MGTRNLFGIFTGWIDELIFKRVIGLLVRKGLDYLVGILLASVFPVFISLGQWILENQVELQAAIIAVIVGIVTTLWSFVQKKKDVVKIRKLEFLGDEKL